ncbi:hypothetical protein SAMN05519103_04005 [Rhizobiales bacterium GAS113]|nr:hypothetical protein SAMN05519103_04005 [Rhizobiales bacterium GAS113]
MSRHPNNGPTFSRAPYKKPAPRTATEDAEYHRRKAAEQNELEASCARTRELNRLLLTDWRAAWGTVGLHLPPPSAPIKRRF